MKDVDGVAESVKAIKKILDSHFLRDDAKDIFWRKVKLNWNNLCDFEEIPKKKPVFGYEDKEYPNSATYYIMELGYSLVVQEGYVNYVQWKREMYLELCFIKDYLYSSCEDSDLDYIIDCVWNSEIYGRSISEHAYLRSSLIKRFLLHRLTRRISYYVILLVEILLLAFVSIDYILVLPYLIILQSIVGYSRIKGKVLNHAIYPIAMIVFNYLCGFLFIANDYQAFLNESWKNMKCGLSIIIFIHGCNTILLLVAIILNANKHNQISGERVQEDCKIFTQR